MGATYVITSDTCFTSLRSLDEFADGQQGRDVNWFAKKIEVFLRGGGGKVAEANATQGTIYKPKMRHEVTLTFILNTSAYKKINAKAGYTNTFVRAILGSACPPRRERRF